MLRATRGRINANRSGSRAAWRRSDLLILLIYLVLPTLVWSLVYRDLKIVADVLPLLVIETFASSAIARVIRLGWCLLCGSMLLLEWNIFPESYAFYLDLMLRAASFPQGRAVAVGFGLLILFLALPPPPRLGRRTLVAFLLVYAILAGAKIWSATKPHLTWLRQPVLRAAQVAWTDSSRLLTASVAPVSYDAYSLGHAQLAAWLDQQRQAPTKIMVILLESWGERPDQFATLVDMVRARIPASEIISGYTAFSGPTLSGEVRELCGKVLSFRAVDASLSECLPRQAQALGYETTAFHGYEGYFYNRQIVYPQIGFARSWFASDLDGAERCGGAFDGVCDDAMLERAFAQLSRPGRQFVYLMSLSAHEPVAADMMRRNYIRSATMVRAKSDGGKRVNEALIDLAISKAGELARDQDVVMYVAGDHNPPGQEARGLPDGKVPYLLLRWRNQGASPADGPQRRNDDRDRASGRSRDGQIAGADLP